MFVMQPVSLHHRLRACGIENLNAPLWALWRQPGPGQKVRRQYVRLAVLLLALTTPALVLAAAGGLYLAGVDVDFAGMASGLAIGMAGAMVISWADDLAFFVAYGVTLGLAVSVALGGGGNVVLGVIFGATFGVALSAAACVTDGRAGGMADGWFLCLVIGVGGVASGGVAAGVAGCVAFIFGLLRIYVWVVEVPVQAVLYLRNRTAREPTLALAPVLHHELSYLPHPFLGAHILATAPHDPELASRALAACAVAPGQRRTRRITLARLQAQELAEAARAQRFAAAAQLNGHWLPGLQEAEPPLLALSQVARYLLAAQSLQNPHNRLLDLARAEADLRSLSNQLVAQRSVLARELRGALPAWQAATAELRQVTEREALRQLPNPFCTGDPLRPELGSALFRGRQPLVRQLEDLLADPSGGASMALLGPWRCGKTSFLRMLPTLLPNAVIAYLDLQASTADSPRAFFDTWALKAAEQAEHYRRLELPLLPAGPPLQAAGLWFEQLDALAARRNLRILLCLDNFECLESAFPGAPKELLQLMGLFRNTIQHRRHLRLLVAGEAPFYELGTLWSGHFINARELQVSHLGVAAARGLLQHPIEGFPPDAIPADVANEIIARTGGQPYLLQLFGSALIDHLNREERRLAQPEDIAKVEMAVLPKAKPDYLRERYSSAPEGAQRALQALAFDQAPALDRNTRRWLRRRLLIDTKNRLTIPLLGRWIREEIGPQPA